MINLTKYDAVEGFDLQDWHIQLKRRIGLWTYFDETEEYITIYRENGRVELYDRESASDFEQLILDDWAAITIDPILKFSTPKIPKRQAVRRTCRADLPKVPELVELVDLMVPTEDPAVVKIPDSISEDYLDKLKAPVVHDCKNRCILTIDLDSAEKILMAQFKAFIREQKKQLPKNIYTDADLKSWCNNKVLPAIDLLIEAKINNEKITNHSLGRALFPDYGALDANNDCDPSERVRRTTRPKALILMTQKTISALEHQLSGTVF